MDDKDYKKEIDLINKYFENLTIKKFEEDLIECGIETIKPASESGYKLITQEELENIIKEDT